MIERKKDGGREECGGGAEREKEEEESGTSGKTGKDCGGQDRHVHPDIKADVLANAI